MGCEDTASRVAAVVVRVASLTGAAVALLLLLLLLLPALRAARVEVMPSATANRSAGDALVLGVPVLEDGVGRKLPALLSREREVMGFALALPPPRAVNEPSSAVTAVLPLESCAGDTCAVSPARPKPMSSSTAIMAMNMPRGAVLGRGKMTEKGPGRGARAVRAVPPSALSPPTPPSVPCSAHVSLQLSAPVGEARAEARPGRNLGDVSATMRALTLPGGG